MLTLAAHPIQYRGMASKEKVGYPSDVSDEEWAFVLPYLLLSRADSAHREHDLRAVFNSLHCADGQSMAVHAA